MALLLNNGAIFLHVPKTGGNWVTTILRESNLVKSEISHKHADIDMVFPSVFINRNVLLKYIMRKLRVFRRSRPFTFCFVRHPLSWYESWFKYMSQPSRSWKDWGDEFDKYNWHPNSILNGLGDPDFNQFVRNVIQERPGYVTELFGSYTKRKIDFIGRQENLVNDLIKVLRIMNVDFDEEFIRNHKKEGTSPEPKERIVWADDLKSEVSKLEYAGIVRYGYLQHEHTAIKPTLQSVK